MNAIMDCLDGLRRNSFVRRKFHNQIGALGNIFFGSIRCKRQSEEQQFRSFACLYKQEVSS